MGVTEGLSVRYMAGVRNRGFMEFCIGGRGRKKVEDLRQLLNKGWCDGVCFFLSFSKLYLQTMNTQTRMLSTLDHVT